MKYQNWITKLTNSGEINIFILLISIICSIQIYLFNEIKKNDIKISQLKNITIKIIEKQNNIKEKINKLDIIERDIEKIHIEVVKLLESNKYIVNKIVKISKSII